MKKTTIAAMLLLPGLFFAQKDQKVPVDDAGLGKLFPDCMLSGSICNLFPKDERPETANANTIKRTENSFDLEIRKSTFSSEKQKAMLGKELSEIREGEVIFLQLEKDFIADPILLQALDIDENYRTVAAGSYPVVISEEFLTIRLTLTD